MMTRKRRRSQILLNQDGDPLLEGYSPLQHDGDGEGDESPVIVDGVPINRGFLALKLVTLAAVFVLVEIRVPGGNRFGYDEMFSGPPAPHDRNDNHKIKSTFSKTSSRTATATEPASRVAVWSPASSVDGDGIDSSVTQKLRQDLADEQRYPSSRFIEIESVSFLSDAEQREYIKKHCKFALHRYDELMGQQQEFPYLANELWKYCALWSSLEQPPNGWPKNNKDVIDAAIYIDGLNLLLVVGLLEIILDPTPIQMSTINSVAVVGPPSNEESFFPQNGKAITATTFDSRFLCLRKEHSHVARAMLEVFVDTPLDVLFLGTTYPFLEVSRELHGMVVAPASSDNTTSAMRWTLLEQSCPSPTRTGTNHVTKCRMRSEFFCSVYRKEDGQVVMLNRLPQPVALTLNTEDDGRTRRPYNWHNISFLKDEIPYISTVREIVFNRSATAEAMTPTPTLYQIFKAENSLPSRECLECLGRTKCWTHEEVCADYFKILCQRLRVLDGGDDSASSHQEQLLQPKFVAKILEVTPPPLADTSTSSRRRVPRIVHQTWYEALTREEYPNMSRLTQSFRQSGWEYKFYTDVRSIALFNSDIQLCISLVFPKI